MLAFYCCPRLCAIKRNVSTEFVLFFNNRIRYSLSLVQSMSKVEICRNGVTIINNSLQSIPYVVFVTLDDGMCVVCVCVADYVDRS